MKTNIQKYSRREERCPPPLKKPSPSKSFRPLDEMRLIDASKFVELDVPARKKHWGPLIQSNQTGMLFGPRGRGKTWVALGMAISMAGDVSFLGQKPHKARRVIYLDGEMDIVTLKARIIDVSKSLKVEPPPGLKIFTPEIFSDLLPSITSADGQRAIDQMIGTDWDVIFVDNYSAWSGDGRETSEAWAPMMRWMLGHKRAGRTVIVVHHTGKTGKQRGSSSHEDALDWSIALKPADDGAEDGTLRFNLVWEKARHLPSDLAQPIAVSMVTDTKNGLVWAYKAGVHDDPRRSRARAMFAEGKTQILIASELKVDRSTVSRWLKAH